MITHLSDTRGKADHGWLKSSHTFSFANYHDPERMGFGALRVINDDTIEPGMGFGTHGHQDMEIITVPFEGALQHKDSVGNSSVIRKGEVQIMSAGTGIYHSEFNASQSEQVKLLQIWVLPEKKGISPRYEQKAFPHEGRQNQLQLVVSPDGREGSVVINQNAYFSLADLTEGHEISYEKHSAGNGLYIFILKGKIEVEGEIFSDRDGIGFPTFDELKIQAKEESEILLMEIPV